MGKGALRINCWVGESNSGVKAADVHLQFLGYLELNKQAKAWQRFDLVGLGNVDFDREHLKANHEVHTRRMPAEGGCWGMAFELCKGDQPVD